MKECEFLYGMTVLEAADMQRSREICGDKNYTNVDIGFMNFRESMEAFHPFSTVGV